MTEARRADTDTSKLYYGWIVVAACNLIACITWGVAIFNQGVFIAHLVSARGWSPAELALSAVLFHVASGISGIPVGRAVDRFGPRLVLVAGAAIISVALYGISLVEEPWHVHLVFIVLGIGYCCIHTITLGKIVARWFVRNRARAMAASTFGAGIGGALFVPLNAFMIGRFGIEGGVWTLIALTLAIILPIALFVVKDGPEVLGLAPDGGELVQSETAHNVETRQDAQSWTVREAMRTLSFWSLSICFSLGMLAQSAFLFYQVPFLQQSFGLLGAASVVSMSTVAAMVGRVVFIAIGDLLSHKAWTIIMFTLQAISFFVLAIADSKFGLMLGSVLFGFTMSIVVVLQPLLTAQSFGRSSFGKIYGPIYLFIRLGMALGPAIIGALLAITGSYSTGWLVLAGSLLLGLLFVPMAVARPYQSARINNEAPH